MQDYTKGPIIGPMLFLMAPILGTHIIQHTYQIIDIYWVSQLGKEAIAAITAVFPIFLFVHYIGLSFTTASNILVSQTKGKNDLPKLKHIVAQSLIASLIFGVVIAIAGYFFSPTLFSLFPLENKVYKLAIIYFSILILATPFKLIFMTFQGLLRGIGEVKIPFYITTVAGFLNIILDPILIFYFKLHVAGAALATSLVEFLSALAAFLILKNHPNLTFTFQNLKPNLSLLKELITLGAPNFIENLVQPIVQTILTSIASLFGTVALAAYGLSLRLSIFSVLPSIVQSYAIVTMVGQNKGANKLDRIKEITIKGILSGVSIILVIGATVWIFTPNIISFFINDRNVVETSTNFTRILILGWIFFAINKVLYGASQGIGDTTTPMLINLVYLLFIRTSLAYILSKIIGFLAIAWAFTISDVIATLLSLILIGRKVWSLDLKGSPKEA